MGLPERLRSLYYQACGGDHVTIGFHVIFAEHVSPDSVGSMTSGLGAYGLLSIDSTKRYVVVMVARTSKTAKLRAQLVEWERYGFLRWSEDSGSN